MLAGSQARRADYTLRPALFYVDLTDTTTDAEFVMQTVSSTGGAFDFKRNIGKHNRAGTIELTTKQLVLVGGQRSIAEALGHIPQANLNYVTTSGLLYMKSVKTAPARGKVVDLMMTDAGNFFLGPVTHLVTAFEKADERAQRPATNYSSSSARTQQYYQSQAPPAPPTANPGVLGYYKNRMKVTYHPGLRVKKLEVYDEGLKRKTVLRIFPSTANFGDIALGTASASGAMIALRLRQVWGI